MKKIITLFVLLVLTLSASAQTLDKNYFCITSTKGTNTIQLLQDTEQETIKDLMILIPGKITTWTTWNGTDKIYLEAGEKMYFKRTKKAKLSQHDNYWVFYFGGSKDVQMSLSGDITTLINPDGNVTDLTSYDYGTFTKLFDYALHIVSAKNLILPSTTLSPGCYDGMFKRCKALTEAPQLPATTMAHGCYESMFEECVSLKNAPALPATKLDHNCYQSMFKGCTSLETAPALPATEVVYECYQNMFRDCTALKTAPTLPATKAAYGCYAYMFDNTGLTVAPELPAKTLDTRCYIGMFYDCRNLVTPPTVLPANRGAERCYEMMFQNCVSLLNAPLLRLEWAADGCCRQMFLNCSSLNISDRNGKKIMYVTGNASAVEWSKDIFKNTADGENITPKTFWTYYVLDCASTTLNDYGYGVYSSFSEVRIKTPGVKAYTGKLNGDVLTLTEITTDIIPDGTGIFLIGGRGMSGQVVEFENCSGSHGDLITDNDLVPSTSKRGILLEREAGKRYYHLNANNLFSESDDYLIRHNTAVITTTSAVNRKNVIHLDVPTAINDLSTPAKVQTKYIDNGRIVIVKNGKKYNAAGQMVE